MEKFAEFDPPRSSIGLRAHRVDAPEQRLTELAGRLSRTVALARALVQGGRQLDLTGIDDGIGMLCAQTLDLPPDAGRAMLPKLRDVLAQVDLLAMGIEAAPGVKRVLC